MSPGSPRCPGWLLYSLASYSFGADCWPTWEEGSEVAKAAEEAQGES